jgi:putative glutamine amidotransferase
MSKFEPIFLVAVSTRVDCIASRGEERDAIDQRLIQWLAESGFVAVLIPNVLAEYPENSSTHKDRDRIQHMLNRLKPRGVILSGGNDIGDVPKRDATERCLLAWAETNRVPLLGICRGMQMMAIWAGAGLKRVNGHVGSRHLLSGVSAKEEWPAYANSYHEWAIDGCPDNFEVVAKAEDGCIEAIRHKYLPWEGWMWHPEREHPANPIDMTRIKRLFDEEN